ncbi:MAG TPA: S1C family serine protease [Chloroflexia bacterium]|nr:S1C family serine protease [Chloroflexia bacterium]
MRRLIVMLVILMTFAVGCDASPAPPAAPTTRPTNTVTQEDKDTPTRHVPSMSDEELAEKLGPSTVLILAQFAETAIDAEGIGGGSGIVYDLENGYILTNAHVVEGASIIKVVTAGSQRTRSARVLGRSTCDDLAVLKVDNTDGLEEAVLGDSDSMRVGAHVMALGYPELFELGTDLTVTTGNISKLNTQRYQFEDLIQTNAAITHGNSGGPLVNTKGEVIGVNTLGFYTAEGEREPGINFAIAMSHAKPIIKELEQGKNRHYIGLNLYPNIFFDYFGTDEGMAVIGLASGSPASQVGIKAADLLLKLEGTTISSEEDVCNILRSHSDGDQLKVQLFRKESGEVLEGEVTIGKVGPSGADTSGLKVISRTADAEPTPTVPVDTETGGGDSGDLDIVLENDFDGDDAGTWPLGDGGEGASTSVGNGLYTINIALESLTYYVHPDETDNIADGVVVADVQLEGDGCGGVLGRYSNDEDGITTYYCWISNAQEFACYKIVSNEWAQIVPIESSDLIKPNESNQITMAIVGTQIVFQINGETVANTTDETDPLPAGYWGVSASTTEGVTDFNAHFNEILVARVK